jgi:hypothetical protein
MLSEYLLEFLLMSSRMCYSFLVLILVALHFVYSMISYAYNDLMFVQAQDAEKQRQLEEESKMSAYELQKKREAEAEVLQHESSKTAHYARLGATFVNRGSPLVGGAAGRGPVPTGRLGGRGNR